jgi:hypothetical protein
MVRWLLLGFLLPVAWLVPVSSASAVTVQARATYHETNDGQVTGVRVEIDRDGQRVLYRGVPKPCGYCALIPTGVFEADHPISVIQLDRTPEPEVVFDFWTGGAHCCQISLVFRYDAQTGRYLPSQHDFYDFGYRFSDLDGNGQFEFRGWDSRFGYRFGCFGCSAFPPQMWAYRDGRLVDTTRAHPEIVRPDLQKQRRRYQRRRGHGDVRPVLAALVADQCLLGRRDAGFRFLNSALRRGYLRLPRSEDGWPQSRAYVHKVRRFLAHTGYCS